MKSPNPNTPWYHGSPLPLTELRAGSTITQNRDLARVFSHKPAIVSQDVDEHGARTIKHTGRRPGFLYRIAEELHDGDVVPHPATTMEPGQEWLTTRALRLELIATTEPRPEELLSDEEVAALLWRSRAGTG